MHSNQDKLDQMMRFIDRLTHIEPSEIPDIPLYMDQVTTFMNERLEGSRQNSDETRMTKTMINNYAKNRLLPAPVKKKYTRNHILMLALIYYYKNVISFSDIETLMKPLGERHFTRGSDPSLTEIYREIFSLEAEQRQNLKEDVRARFRKAQETFLDAPEDERENLQLFAFLSELAFDVYIKKELIELAAEQIRKACGEHSTWVSVLFLQ